MFVSSASALWLFRSRSAGVVQKPATEAQSIHRHYKCIHISITHPIECVMNAGSKTETQQPTASAHNIKTTTNMK